MKTRLLLALLLGLAATLAQAGEREATAWQKIDDGAAVIDVRTLEEYMGGHLQASVLIPHQQIVKKVQRLGIPEDREIVLYCRSGNRAGIAEAALRETGYDNLFNAGGYQALVQERARR